MFTRRVLENSDIMVSMTPLTSCSPRVEALELCGKRHFATSLEDSVSVFRNRTAKKRCLWTQMLLKFSNAYSFTCKIRNSCASWILKRIILVMCLACKSTAVVLFCTCFISIRLRLFYDQRFAWLLDIPLTGRVSKWSNYSTGSRSTAEVLGCWDRNLHTSCCHWFT